MTRRSQWAWVLGIVGTVSLAGCQEPDEIVPSAPPGLEAQRTPPPEKEEPQALGEPAMQAPVDSSMKKAVTGNIAPPTASGETKTTPSGVSYETLKPGDGPEIKPGQTITVHYKGSLADGKVFENSREKNEPATFKIGAGEMIPGWDEAVPGMRVGETRKLSIPAELAYGANGKPPTIPPNAPLTFEIEVIGFK